MKTPVCCVIFFFCVATMTQAPFAAESICATIYSSKFYFISSQLLSQPRHK
jgi:hypothetical protein